MTRWRRCRRRVAARSGRSCSWRSGSRTRSCCTSGGYIDAAANAYTYVLLALGLNIVVGFSGLLDLGYAAFFAIGAYTYGAAASGHLKIPWSDVLDAVPLSRPGPAGAGRGRARSGPDAVLVLGDAGRGGARVRALRRAVRRADPPPPRRLSRHRDARVRRDRAGGGAQLGLVHQRGPGHGRDPHAEAVRLRLRVLAVPVLLPGPRPGGGRGVRLLPAPGVAGRAGVDGDSRGRAGGGRHGREPRPLQAARVRARRVDRRAGRDLLRRQAHHRHPGDVPVPGVRHDPGHGRARRHGLGAGGRAGGAPPRVPPVGRSSRSSRSG